MLAGKRMVNQRKSKGESKHLDARVPQVIGFRVKRWKVHGFTVSSGPDFVYGSQVWVDA